MNILFYWGCQIIKLAQWAIGLTEKIPASLPPLLARFAIAPVFWFSGRTKVDGFSVHPNAVYQFGHDFGFPAPAFFATMAALAEHILPIMLILGLGTRFAAAGLLVMTIVIQFVFPSGWWNHHALWLAILLYLTTQGSGRIALDPFVPKLLEGLKPAEKN